MFIHPDDCIILNRTCKNCYIDGNGKYKQENECVEKCSNNAVTNYTAHICEVCSKFYDSVSKKCVNSCPENTKSDVENKLCIYCGATEKYYFQEDCLTECPSYTQPENYICQLTNKVCPISCFNGGKSTDTKCNCPSEKNNLFGDFCEIQMIYSNTTKIVQYLVLV